MWTWTLLAFLLLTYAVVGVLAWKHEIWMPLFASKTAREMANAIRATNYEDWEITEYNAACERLNITLAHSNGGVYCRLYHGVKRPSYGGITTPDAPPAITGGADGVMIYRGFRQFKREAALRGMAKAYDADARKNQTVAKLIK